MKTIVIGSIIFIAWSGISTYYYVCQIKGLCLDKQVQISESVDEIQLSNNEPEATESSEREAIETEEVSDPEPVTPGSFVIHHNYNHQDFILDEEFNAYVDQVEAFINQHPATKINITGYADNIGPEEYNYDLGLERANFIRDYMVKNGIPGSTITVLSMGEDSPMATNETKTGRAENRRTEIEIKQ